MSEPIQDDGAFIDTAAGIVAAAQNSNDPRLITLVRQVTDAMQDWQLMATLLLRYKGLIAEVDELTAEIERLEGARDAQSDFLQRRTG